MTVPIVPVVPTEIGTFGENVYTDSTSGQLPTYDPSQYILSLKLSSKYGSTPTVTEILPTYIDKLKVFRIVSRGGYHQSLEMVFDDSDNVLSGLGAFAEGSALSVAIQYTKISDSTITSYNVGVYFVSSLLAEDDTLSITADTLVERMGDISVEGSIFLASTDFAPQLGSLLTSLHIPTNIGTTPSTSGYKIDLDTTLPRMSLWDMIECYNCDRRSRNSASWTFASRIVVKPDGKVGYVSTLHTAPRYDIYRTDMVTEPKRVSDAIYNYVQLMYDETNCYYRDKRTSSGDDVRVLTYDNPFIKTLNRATRCSALTPPENVTPIWSVDVIAKIPLDYMIHEMIRVHRKDSTAEHERYDYAIITGVSYEYDGGTIIATLDYVLEDDVYAVFATGTTTITDAQRYGEYVASKQDELVSGTNIKTINNQTILGSGNIEISGGEGNYVTVDTAQSITGEKTFLADNAFCTVNIKTTRTSGNIGGINFRANDGTTKAQIYGTIGGELISMTSPNNNSAFGCIVTKGSLASMFELVHTTGNETIAGVKSFMSDLNIGSSSTSANLNVYGNITLNGEAYEVHAEKIFTKNDYIIMRDGAVSGLASGDYSGFQIRKYDGTNDGRLVVDNEGVARVGDVGDEQPLLTRSDSGSMTTGQVLRWDGTTYKAVSDGQLSHSISIKASGAPTGVDPYAALTGIQVKRTDSAGDVGFGIDTGGVNHGVYSNTQGKWMVYADRSNVYLNGNASTATALSAVIANDKLPARIQIENRTAVNSTSGAYANGFHYVADSSPFTRYHSGNVDYNIVAVDYSSGWGSQLASDFRTNYLFKRYNQNGTWSRWDKIFSTADCVSVCTDHTVTVGTSNTWFKIFECDFTQAVSWTEWAIEFEVYDGWSGTPLVAKYKARISTNGTKSTDNKSYLVSSYALNCVYYSGTGNLAITDMYLYVTKGVSDTTHKAQIWAYIDGNQTQYIFRKIMSSSRSGFNEDNWQAITSNNGQATEPAYVTSGDGTYRVHATILPINGYTLAPACAKNVATSVSGSDDHTHLVTRKAVATKLADYVTLLDAQTISGAKTFTDNVKISKENGNLIFVNPNAPYGQNTGAWLGNVTMKHSNSSANVGLIDCQNNTTYNMFRLASRRLNSSGTTVADCNLKLYSMDNGTTFITASSRAYASAEATDVLVKGHIASISDLVHTTGNETIAGTKTFSNNIVGSINRASADGDGNVISATYLKLSGGSMTGALFAKAEDIGAGYSHAKVRNIIISTSAPTGGSNGDIWLQYDA